MTNNTKTPLVFVYLGGQLPQYAYFSLEMAAANSSVNVYLIVEEFPTRKLDERVAVYILDSFYKRSDFLKFKQQTLLDQDFFGGFWLHTVERLFVLKYFATKMGFSSYFHAELDILFFDLSNLASNLSRLSPAIYVPRDSFDRAMASLIYVSSNFAFERLIDFVVSQKNGLNEMQILSLFIDKYPQYAKSLPSDNALSNTSDCWPYVSESEIEGIVDCAALGQWFFGIDPKISGSIVRNGFVNDALSVNLNDFRFILSKDRTKLSCIGPTRDIHNIYSLHVHSKIHQQLTKQGVLEKYIDASNSGKKIVVVWNLRSIWKHKIGLLKHLIKQSRLYKNFRS